MCLVSPEFQFHPISPELNWFCSFDFCSSLTPCSHSGPWSSGGNRRSRTNTLSHTLFPTKTSTLHRLPQHPTAWILSHQNLSPQRRPSNGSYLRQHLKKRLDSHYLTVACVDSDSLPSHRSIPGEQFER